MRMMVAWSSFAWDEHAERLPSTCFDHGAAIQVSGTWYLIDTAKQLAIECMASPWWVACTPPVPQVADSEIPS